MQHEVVNFATALLQIKAQIICQHFTDDTIVKISGAMQLSPQDQQLIPQALALLKDEPAKNFRIEVTSDSMIYQDEQQEKQDRVEFLTAVSGFMQTALPVAQGVPELTPLLMEMLKFGVTAFKAGKGLEGLIDETADQFRQQAEAAKGQPKPPSPEEQKMQMQMQMEQQKMQMQQQIEQAKIQGEIELEKAKQEFQAQENQLKFQLEDQRNREQMQMEMQLEQAKMDTTNNKELLLAYLNNAAKIETTRISSGLDNGEAAYADNIEMANFLQDQLGNLEMKNHPLQPAIENMQLNNQQLAQMLAMIIEKLNQPKTVIRGPDGRIAGVQ
jgi:flagellar biosynthesis GTPase FlhF